MPNLGSDLIFSIKRFYQRGRNGIAKSDSWDLDCYLSMIIVKGCNMLLKRHLSYPPSLKNIENCPPSGPSQKRSSPPTGLICFNTSPDEIKS